MTVSEPARGELTLIKLRDKIEGRPSRSAPGRPEPENDDIVLAQNTNSQIPPGGGFFVLPQTGTYIIESTSFARNRCRGPTVAFASSERRNNFGAGVV